jgi:hypothetical protein
MEGFCTSQEMALEELEKLAPGAPFLALGQTVFWDEPMKSGVIQTQKRLGYSRRFIAGVHDTDYFAKSPYKTQKRGFTALPHNDTTTKGLWSAAGEFSFLFGSETVISRDQLKQAGVKVARVENERPGLMDELTEAWGWRGIVSNEADSKITAEMPLEPLFRELFDTFEWAVKSSLNSISGRRKNESRKAAEKILSQVCKASGDGESLTLTSYYKRLLPIMFSAVAGEPVAIDVSSTTELLRFNTQTVRQARFDIFDLFVRPETRQDACDAYNEAVQGSEIYTLDRFGTGALPFDLYIPGVGRGTIRLGNRGCVINTPDSVAFSFKRPIRSAAEFAEKIEERYGPDCVLIGKAVSLIGMLATEHVFVFHEGASSYVWRSREMHKALAKRGHKLKLNPILRVSYNPWDAFSECEAWLKMPEPLRRPFGVDELSAAGFSLRWKAVAQEASDHLDKLSELKQPLDLIRYLQSDLGGHWRAIGAEYERLHDLFAELNKELSKIKKRKKPVLKKLKELRLERAETEIAKGNHWRQYIFEKSPAQEQIGEREAFENRLEQIEDKIDACRQEWLGLQKEQDELVFSNKMLQARKRRQTISLEAELMRIQLIREAVIASEGLDKAAHRPAAWWFPIVSPSGGWHEATMQRAQYSLEPLV